MQKFVFIFKFQRAFSIHWKTSTSSSHSRKTEKEDIYKQQIRRARSFFLFSTYSLSVDRTKWSSLCHFIFIFIFCLRYIFCLYPMSQRSRDSSVSKRGTQGNVRQVDLSFSKMMNEWIIRRRFRRNISLVCQQLFVQSKNISTLSRKTSDRSSLRLYVESRSAKASNR